MTIFKDGINANKIAADYIKIKTYTSNTEKLQIHLASGGGFAIKLTP